MIQLIYVQTPDHDLGLNAAYECGVLIENCDQCHLEKDWSTWDASVPSSVGSSLDACRDHRDKLILQYKEV